MRRASLIGRASWVRPNQALVIATALLVAWLGCRILWASAATDQPVRRVLLIMDRPQDPFLERIGAEIAGLGLTIVALGPRTDKGLVGPLEAVARSQQAVAAIRVLPTRKGVEVWMADETSGRSLLRQVVVDESPGGPNEGLVALQTAELLRTSLLPKPRAAPSASASAPRTPLPPPSASAAAPVAPGPSASPSGALGLGAGMGALHSAGGADTSLELWLSLHRSFGQRWAVALDLAAPLRNSRLSGPEGSAELGAYVVGLAGLVRFEGRSPALFANVGLGAALVYLHSKAHPNVPLVPSTSTDATTAAAYLRGDAGFRIAPWFALGIRGIAGTTLGRVTIHFAGNQAGSWGAPFVAGLGFAEVRF